MEITKAFKSGNTIRITLGRRARYALNLERGDMLRLEAVRPGVATITNLSHEAREKTKQRKK